MYAACYPITKPVRSTQPAFENEPLTIDEAKRQCGVALDVTYFDDDFRSWIVAARQQVEHDAQIAFYTGTYTWKFTSFPYADFFEIPCVRPVTSITSITYIDTDGSTATVTTSDYALDTNGLRPMVKLTYGNVWPTTRSDINGITVTFVAGYSAISSVPAQYKQAVILKARSHYLTALGEDGRRNDEAYDRQINLIGLEVVA